MKKRALLLAGGTLVLAAAMTAFTGLPAETPGATASIDPRQEAPVVKVARPEAVTHAGRLFTGTVAARVQSNLGFRVGGKVVERMTDVGRPVTRGQPLMRLDSTDLRLALTARRHAVAAARAVFVQAEADEKRYADLARNGWAPRQRYEQARAALDTAKAQLASAEAEARVAENEEDYALLLADQDGTVVETLAEPGQVVAAGQPVIRLAHAGPREAVIALPETVRPKIGSTAEAALYGSEGSRVSAELRQLSDAADPQSRTYEARYVLAGEAARAPLGATVSVRLISRSDEPEVRVPLGAVLDDGRKTGVWVLETSSSTVRFRPVVLGRVSDEAAVVTGLGLDETVVSLGAHLLQEGAAVRVLTRIGSTR